MCYGPAQSGQGYFPRPHLATAEPRVFAKDETGLGTISFSFSANTDRDYKEKGTSGNMPIIFRNTQEYFTEFPD